MMGLVALHKTITVTERTISLTDAGTSPQHALDTLLASASDVYADKLVVVLLGETAQDAVADAIVVKNNGGFVVVEQPVSGALTVPAVMVDVAITRDALGAMLADLLVADAAQIATYSEDHNTDAWQRILDHAALQSSVDLRAYNEATLRQQVARRMAATHSATLTDYLTLARTEPAEVGALVNNVLVNYTGFFRDTVIYDYLRTELLPQLIAYNRSQRVLRLWSAGCATGEEPYSMVMLLADILGAELAEWNIKVFATDTDKQALTFARNGVYSQKQVADLPDDFRERFFTPHDDHYQISPTLRQLIIFGEHDLSRNAPFPAIDLLLCRNVLMYLRHDSQKDVLTRLAYTLGTTRGFLVLGKAEHLPPGMTLFSVVNRPLHIYRGFSKPVITPSIAPAKTTPPEPPLQMLPDILNDQLFRLAAVGIVGIDQSYRVLSANATARRLLGLNTSTDFLHSVWGLPYDVMRQAIDRAFETRNIVALSEVKLTNTPTAFAFTITPSADNAIAAITITDVTEPLQVLRTSEASNATQTQLAQQVAEANERLNDQNITLTETNNELQISNEELIVAHEELQTTIEEFETTNEELQSTTEELEAANEELHTTNTELEVINAEIESRNIEMIDVLTELEKERARLAQMVEIAPFAIMVLRGADLRLDAATAQFAWPVDNQPPQGRPLAQLVTTYWDGAGRLINDLARKAYNSGTPQFAARVKTYVSVNATVALFDYMLVPTRDPNKSVTGVVIYATDATVRQAKLELERLQLIFDHAPQVALALYDDKTGDLLSVSPRYRELGATGRWPEQIPLLSPDAATEIWQQVHRTGLPVRRPEIYDNRSDTAEESVWDWTLTPIMEADNPDEINALLVSAIEITQQVRLRVELEQLNERKDEFLSVASHELRTPLTTIKGRAQMLERLLARRTGDFGREREMLASFDQQANRMVAQIEEMLDVTRMRTGQFTLDLRPDVDIAVLTQDVIAAVRESGINHPVTYEGAHEPVTLRCDDVRIRQVLTNLIDNAAKYSEAGKPIRVRLDITPAAVAISVQDKGQGIAPEKQARLFERFYRATDKTSRNVTGLGLGLYICDQIVRQHGGQMTVTSEPGDGSTFSFSLPRTTVDG